MRDLILLAMLAFVAGLTTRSTIVGIMTWMWVSLLSPQREVYGFLANFEINLYVALFTVMCWVASRERKIFPLNGVTGALFLFGIWISVTTVFALAPEHSTPLYVRTLKTMVLALGVATLANTPARIQATIWALVLSVGYYGIRGGGFVLLTGGQNKVFGPEGTMIEDNNLLGIALVALLPFWNYLRVTSRLKLVRLACLGALAVTILAIVGTYSRGAFVALGVLLVLSAVRSRWGIALIMVGAIGLVAVPTALPSILPATWVERMQSIQSLNQDASFAGRVAAWKTSMEIARQRPLTGGGFASTEVKDVVTRFHTSGGLTTPLAAHSIYFQVLADHGVVGFVLYAAMVGFALLNTFRVIIMTRTRPDLYWANKLSRAIQLSVFGFLVGGAALSAAYYDLYLIVFCLSAVLMDYVRREVHGLNVDRAPAWKRTMPKRAATLPQHSKLVE
jgi:probable O-glycosylation ligase (exosortase A-associated)